MAKSQQTYNKSEKEKKRRKKKQDKAERRLQRKQEKLENGPVAFEDLIRYVDEDGNLTTEKPDPTKKRKEIKAEDIMLGVPVRTAEPGEQYRSGRVKFFNHEKGFGFIDDSKSQDSIFVFINNAYPEIKENDKVTFETERGPKGPVAVNVKLAIDKPAPKPEPKKEEENTPESDTTEES